MLQDREVSREWRDRSPRQLKRPAGQILSGQVVIACRRRQGTHLPQPTTPIDKQPTHLRALTGIGEADSDTGWLSVRLATWLGTEGRCCPGKDTYRRTGSVAVVTATQVQQLGTSNAKDKTIAHATSRSHPDSDSDRGVVDGQPGHR